ncbi:bifunctional riboflavin kinase/FAD synthetase [Virgibacillus soli]|uniref:bifunctional riboflavin kinase/FAD synthetase n=1 Tax=Paracerasibacillus soli TaxID=480284 RepID=UPI0035EB23A1
MRTIELMYPHILQQQELPETVAAIGFFDGIHKGHQKVIKTAVSEAKKRGMESAVITFHPHPSVVLKADAKDVKYITPIREKQEILQQMNVDRLYLITFNKELSGLSPQAFLDHFIIGLNIKHVVAGFDFTFGHKGKGNMQTIGQLTRGFFTHTVIDKVEYDAEKISSTKIRELLATGDVTTVQQLLGRPLYLHGTVIDGAKRGRKLGFPTANLQFDSEILLPKTGIYAVKVIYKNESYDAMASLGFNPTFHDENQQRTLEVNILDYSHDIYGKELKLEWYAFIREEKKFSSVEDLIEQMKKDEVQIRQYFKESH